MVNSGRLGAIEPTLQCTETRRELTAAVWHGTGCGLLLGARSRMKMMIGRADWCIIGVRRLGLPLIGPDLSRNMPPPGSSRAPWSDGTHSDFTVGCVLGRLALRIRHMQQFRRFPLCRFPTPVVVGCGSDIGMACELLCRRDVRAGIEQIRNEGPPQIMR